MLPADWARAVHVRWDIRGALRDLADYAAEDGQFTITLNQLAACSGMSHRNVERMLALLERAQAVTHYSKPGPNSCIRGRLQIEREPAAIEQRFADVVCKLTVGTLEEDRWATLTAADRSYLRQRLFDRDGVGCRRCGSLDRLQIDHIRAMRDGGTSAFDNLQVLCVPCHGLKSADDRRRRKATVRTP